MALCRDPTDKKLITETRISAPCGNEGPRLHAVCDWDLVYSSHLARQSFNSVAALLKGNTALYIALLPTLSKQAFPCTY